MENIEIIFKISAEVYNDEGSSMNLINEGLLCLVRHSSRYFLRLHDQNSSCIWKCKLAKGMQYKKVLNTFYKLLSNDIKFAFDFNNEVAAAELNVKLTDILNNLPKDSEPSIRQPALTSVVLPENCSSIQPEIVESIIQMAVARIMPYINQLDLKIKELEKLQRGNLTLQNKEAPPNRHEQNSFPTLQPTNVISTKIPPARPPPFKPKETIVESKINIPPPPPIDAALLGPVETKVKVVGMPTNLLEDIRSRPKLKALNKKAVDQRAKTNNSNMKEALINHPLLNISSR